MIFERDIFFLYHGMAHGTFRVLFARYATGGFAVDYPITLDVILERDIFFLYHGMAQGTFRVLFTSYGAG